jgi:thiol-disulfide isomerase/thioredoxin
MVKRSIGIALVATFIAFSAGMLLQWHIDQQRSLKVEDEITDLRLATNSIMTERELSDVFDRGECALNRKRINNRMETLDGYGSKLERFEEREIFSSAAYKRLSHEYHLLQLFQWAKVIQVAENCPDSQFVPLLFFYGQDCDSCEDQGLVLTALKKQYGDKLQVFSIDTGMERREPAVSAVTDRFNVTRTPVIVIGTEQRFPRFMTKKDLEPVIKQYLNQTTAPAQ